MTARTYYYVCNLKTGEALQYVYEFPDTFGNITGFAGIDPVKAQDLTVFGMPGMGFIPEAEIGKHGINQVSMLRVKQIAAASERLTVLQERDNKLTYSDRWVVSDRWEKYSDDQKTQLTAYRQTLRDMGSSTVDWFNPVWPTMPGFVT